MMKRTIILVVAMAAAALGLPGQAQAACAPAVEPAISVRLDDPGPRVKSTKTLRQINAMAGSHSLRKQGYVVLGLTEIDLETSFSARFKGVPVNEAVCLDVTDITLKFGFKKHYVHVPKEYPRGGCHYNFVIRHEMAHVRVNRNTVRKYAAILKNEMRSALRRQGVVRASSMAQGKRVYSALLQNVVDDVIDRLNAELERRHAKIDAPGSTYDAQGACQGW